MLQPGLWRNLLCRNVTRASPCWNIRPERLSPCRGASLGHPHLHRLSEPPFIWPRWSIIISYDYSSVPFIFHFHPNIFLFPCQCIYYVTFFLLSDTISALTQSGTIPPRLLCLPLYKLSISKLFSLFLVWAPPWQSWLHNVPIISLGICFLSVTSLHASESHL